MLNGKPWKGRFRGNSTERRKEAELEKQGRHGKKPRQGEKAKIHKEDKAQVSANRRFLGLGSSKKKGTYSFG